MSAARHLPKGRFFVLSALWLLTMGWLRAADNAPGELPTAEFAFQADAPGGVRVALTGQPAFFAAVQRTGGAIEGDADPVWRVAAEAPFGEGSLDFTLDRTRLSGDLALVLRAAWTKDSDVAIQLFDAAGVALATDLFGNLARNAETAATDTFIVPLTRYPQATRLSVRRLSGPLSVRAAGLFPVLSELPATAQGQQAIARQLGLVFQPSVPAATAAGLGQVHASPPLERANQIAAAALAQPDYPVFRRLTRGRLDLCTVAASGTTFDFVRDALRAVGLEAGSALGKPVFTSSDGVAYALLRGEAAFGAMSVPLTSAQKEEFFQRRGFPILEFSVARDAIEVLVNAANPVTELTIPQLDAVFAQTPQAGARQLVREWSELGAGRGDIVPFGGWPGWGTSKTFQQLVLKGGAFRRDLRLEDVVYREGVEAEVASNPAAIGYVSLRPRQADVRPLAIAANSGGKAWTANAETIYTGRYPLQRTFYGYLARPNLAAALPTERELINLLLSSAGQAMVGRSGSLPLSARETLEARAALGLPTR